MSSRDDSAPAFPAETVSNYHIGMTLRDYFAAKELSKTVAVACCDIPEAYERLADHCYRMADAMLKERNK